MNQEEKMCKRFGEVREKLGKTPLEFAEELGTTRSNIYNIEAGRRGVSFDMLVFLIERYNVSFPWIVSGEGPMFYDSGENPLVNAKEKKRAQRVEAPVGIPLIPIEAVAGIATQTDYQITFDSIQDRYVIPLFEGKQVDFLTYVRGSSMYPKYSSGDVVACRFIRERLYIQWNKVYVIDTVSQGVMIKRLKKSSVKGHITFRSDNKEYDDFEVPEKDIRNLAIVVGVIRLE